MNVLCVDSILLVKSFQVRIIIKELPGRQSLLVISGGVLIAHIFHNLSLRWDFPFHCSPLREKSLDLRPVFFYIIIVYLLMAFYVEDRRLMEVAHN